MNEGREMDQRVAEKSEMIRKRVRGEDGRGSVSMCSRQLKIACNSVVKEEDFSR